MISQYGMDAYLMSKATPVSFGSSLGMKAASLATGAAGNALIGAGVAGIDSQNTGAELSAATSLIAPAIGAGVNLFAKAQTLYGNIQKILEPINNQISKSGNLSTGEQLI